MTLWSVSKGIAEYLGKHLHSRVYAGFLPKIESAKDKERRIPAVAVRVTEMNENLNGARHIVNIYVMTYDEDKECGCESLYHELERIRLLILAENPIERKYQVNLKESAMIITIPDEQPYPYWIGAIEIEVKMEGVYRSGILSWSENKRNRDSNLR